MAEQPRIHVGSPTPGRIVPPPAGEDASVIDGYVDDQGKPQPHTPAGTYDQVRDRELERAVHEEGDDPLEP